MLHHRAQTPFPKLQPVRAQTHFPTLLCTRIHTSDPHHSHCRWQWLDIPSICRSTPYNLQLTLPAVLRQKQVHPCHIRREDKQWHVANAPATVQSNGMGICPDDRVSTSLSLDGHVDNLAGVRLARLAHLAGLLAALEHVACVRNTAQDNRRSAMLYSHALNLKVDCGVLQCTKQGLPGRHCCVFSAARRVFCKCPIDGSVSCSCQTEGSW